MSDHQERIALLKMQRSHLAAFGQTEKVKAVDLEIAELRRGRGKSKRSEPRVDKPVADVETATADTSSVESASTSARKRAARRRSTASGD